MQISAKGLKNLRALLSKEAQRPRSFGSFVARINAISDPEKRATFYQENAGAYGLPGAPKSELKSREQLEMEIAAINDPLQRTHWFHANAESIAYAKWDKPQKSCTRTFFLDR